MSEFYRFFPNFKSSSTDVINAFDGSLDFDRRRRALAVADHTRPRNVSESRDPIDRSEFN